MARRKPPIYSDRGHGIGKHTYNDCVLGKQVREVTVYDVDGTDVYSYDLDTKMIRKINDSTGRGPWVWEQVREVVERDLQTMGRTWGDAYGSFSDYTMYGLYNGRRPKHYTAAEWD